MIMCMSGVNLSVTGGGGGCIKTINNYCMYTYHTTTRKNRKIL